MKDNTEHQKRKSKQRGCLICGIEPRFGKIYCPDCIHLMMRLMNNLIRARPNLETRIRTLRVLTDE